MREVLPPVVAFGFKTMDLDAIAAMVDARNTRCQVLLEGLGFAPKPNPDSSLLAYALRRSTCA